MNGSVSSGASVSSFFVTFSCVPVPKSLLRSVSLTQKYTKIHFEFSQSEIPSNFLVATGDFDAATGSPDGDVSVWMHFYGRTAAEKCMFQRKQLEKVVPVVQGGEKKKVLRECVSRARMNREEGNHTSFIADPCSVSYQGPDTGRGRGTLECSRRRRKFAWH